MAGEHEFAQQALEEALESARAKGSLNEEVFSRALMYQLLDYYQKGRTVDDIVSEIEDHIRSLEDGGEHVVTRGC